MDLHDVEVAIDVERQILDDLLDNMIENSSSIDLESCMFAALDCVRSIKKKCEYKKIYETLF